MKPKTLAEIHDDLLVYLNDDECVDPIGYLEGLQLDLQAAIARLDSAELGLVPALSAPSEPVQDKPRGWADQAAALRWAAEHLDGKATTSRPVEPGDTYAYAVAAFRGDATTLRFLAGQVERGQLTVPTAAPTDG